MIAYNFIKANLKSWCQNLLKVDLVLFDGRFCWLS